MDANLILGEILDISVQFSGKTAEEVSVHSMEIHERISRRIPGIFPERFVERISGEIAGGIFKNSRRKFGKFPGGSLENFLNGFLKESLDVHVVKFVVKFLKELLRK